MFDEEYDEEELRKDVLGAAMTKELGYNQDFWLHSGPLSKNEYSDIGLASSGAIQRRFADETQSDGWNQLKDELGLEKPGPGSPEVYSPEEMVLKLKQQGDDGVAPRRDDASPVGSTYSFKDTKLFQSYLDAVWLAGLEPCGRWFQSKHANFEELIANEYRRFTVNNYWSGDSQLDQKDFEAPINHKSPYLNPASEAFKQSTDSRLASVDGSVKLPNMRLGYDSKPLSRREQDLIMRRLENSSDYHELEKKVEEEGFTRNNMEAMLDPGAEPEYGGSYGRWMSQDEFPDKAIMFTSGADPRPSPNEIKRKRRYEQIREKEMTLRAERQGNSN